MVATYSAKYAKTYRAGLVKSGLTTMGTERIRKQHKNLAGLSRREYNTSLMRMRRKELKELSEWTSP